MSVIFKKLRPTIAFALTLWCAGAGCMLVSYAHGMSMSQMDSTRAEAGKNKRGAAAQESSSHSCCKARHRSAKHVAEAESLSTSPDTSTIATELFETPAPAGAMNCCPLTTGSFVAPSRTSEDDTNGAVLAQDLSRIAKPANPQPARVTIPLRLRDSEHTYLRCCAFLI